MTEISDRRVPVKEVGIVPKQAELTYTEERASPGSLRDNKDGHIVPKQAQLTYTEDNAQPGSLWDIKEPVNKDVNNNTQPKRNVPAAKDNKKENNQRAKQPLKEKNANVNNSNFGTRDVPFQRASGERISLPKSKNIGKKYWSWSLRHKPR